MKILFISPCSRPYQNGSLVLKYLKRLGHEVLAFDYRLHPALPVGNWPVLKSHWVYPFIYRAIPVQNQLLIRQGLDFAPNLILTIKGESVLPQTIYKLKQHTHAPAILWFPDDPQLFNAISRHIAPAYDIVLTNSREIVPRYQALGVKKVHWMGFACDPEVHKRVELTPQEREVYGADVCFIGACYPTRLKFLRHLADFDLKIWGPHWYRPLVGPLSRRVMGSGLYHAEMVKAFNAAKIVINIHLKRQRAGAVNMRNFEVTGCGAFLLSDYVLGLDEVFRIDSEIACYKSGEELVEKVRYYLDHQELREQIAQAGHLRTYREYTFEERIKQLLAFV